MSLIINFSFFMIICYAVGATSTSSEIKRSDGPKPWPKHGSGNGHHLTREVEVHKKNENERHGDPDNLLEYVRSFTKKDMETFRSGVRAFRKAVDTVDDVLSEDDGTVADLAMKAIQTFNNIRDFKNIKGIEDVMHFFTPDKSAQKKSAQKKGASSSEDSNFFTNMIKPFMN